MSMITASCWVPRGYAAEFPTRHEFDQDELDRIARLTKLNLDDATAGLEQLQTDATPHLEQTDSKSRSNGLAQTIDDDELKEYNLNDYDEEPEDDPSNADPDAPEGTQAIFGNIKALAYHESNDDDPYITLKGGETADSDDEDREDLQILPKDSLLLAARVEDEVAHLEVYVYEDDADNLYVHHDIMLPAIPLCVEWLNYPAGREQIGQDSRASFVAVGTMDPDIELWDLDTMDTMFPNAILGAGSTGNDPQSIGKNKKKKKAKKARDTHHVDAVLSLAANRQHRNLLASASADTTVKLWDLTTQKCAKSYAFHSDKVSSLVWHPSEATAMLSGSYDRSVVAADMRAPEAGVRRWAVDAEVETVKWDPNNENHFFVSTENGMLSYFDARTAGSGASPLWRLQAHEKSVTSFAASAHLPGLLATGSDDRTVKLWDTRDSTDEARKGPTLLVSRDLDAGRIFTTSFAPDEEVGLRLAVAGSKGALSVWDVSTNKFVRAAFTGQLANGDDQSGYRRERIISAGDGGADSESDSDSEEDEDGAEGGEGWEDAGSDEEMGDA